MKRILSQFGFYLFIGKFSVIWLWFRFCFCLMNWDRAQMFQMNWLINSFRSLSLSIVFSIFHWYQTECSALKEKLTKKKLVHIWGWFNTFEAFCMFLFFFKHFQVVKLLIFFFLFFLHPLHKILSWERKKKNPPDKDIYVDLAMKNDDKNKMFRLRRIQKTKKVLLMSSVSVRNDRTRSFWYCFLH